MTRRHRRIEPIALAQLTGGTLIWREAPEEAGGAPKVQQGGPLTIPPSLVRPACPECASHVPSGDGADFVHDAGCGLGEELAEEHRSDQAALDRLLAVNLPARLHRVATGAEVDVWAAWDVEATAAPVVVQLDDDGRLSRWWPTLAADR